MKTLKNNDDVSKSLRLSDEGLFQSIQQIKIGVVIAIGMLVGFIILVVFLDMNSKTFEKSARYRPPAETLTEEDINLTTSPSVLEHPVQGQTVYVPAYSHIYHQDGSPALLTITLSVRNTSSKHEIVIESVDYFDTNGKQVKTYLKKSLRLRPMATTEFLVERDDKSGGSGASFLVKWVSEQIVSEPMIAAVMIDTDRQQGISFVTSGSVIEEVSPVSEMLP